MRHMTLDIHTMGIGVVLFVVIYHKYIRLVSNDI